MALVMQTDARLAACLQIVQHHRTDVAIAVLAMVLQAVTIVLGYFTWSQFGWRTYSKLACDMRIKNAQQLRVTYILMNCYQTLLKLDFQVGILLVAIIRPLAGRPCLTSFILAAAAGNS